MDKIGVLALTLFFLSVKVNKYYALIGSFVFYIFYYRYSEGFTSTSMPNENNENNELVEPNKIYNLFLNLIEDYDTKSFNSDALNTDVQEIDTNYWIRLFSDYNIIESKYFIKEGRSISPEDEEEMFTNTLERLMTILDSVEVNTGENDSGYKNIKENLKNTYLGERISYIYYDRLSSPKKEFNAYDETNQNSINVTNLIKNAEFKKVDFLNKEAKQYSIDNNKNIKQVEFVSNLTSQFSETMINIIQDIIDLLNKEVKFTSVYDSYLYYIRNIFLILTDNGRLFYVGLFFMTISLCFFFIESTK
tara:strand:+ start:338 stop:1252 length:915 start_codon:yes stop_codon:yes gene_type:complete